MHAMTDFNTGAAERFARDYEQAFYRGDHEELASAYMQDARLVAQDMEPIVGRRAIEGFWKQACERARSVDMRRSIRHDDVERSGDLGYMLSIVRLEIPAPGSRPLGITSRSVTVWRREPDGVWRMAIDLSNRKEPMEPGQFAYGVKLGD